MSIELITILMFVGMLVLIFIGVPLAFAVGAVSLATTYWLWGPESLSLAANQATGMILNHTLASVPFFVLMANILGGSGIAEDFYETMYKWMGPLRGGLAIGSIIICTAIAAMSGVSAVGVVTMGTIALPAMLRRNYDRGIALGSILAGGALGQLIPPSLLAIVFSGMANISIGKMFMAGVLPGLLLASLFCLYVGLRCALQPKLCPALSLEERQQITWTDKLISLRGVLPSVLLIVGVLGSLFAGIATPTESAAVGAAGALVLSLLYGRMTWVKLREACYATALTTAMIMWLAMSSLLFVAVYVGLGGDVFIKKALLGTGLNRWSVLAIMMGMIFVLGMVMDPVGIIFLTTPVFLPIITALGFDPLWYGGMVIVNLETSYLTPPFGYNLFYLKAVAPPEVAMQDLYRAVPPFVAIQLFGLLLCALYPGLITYLPSVLLN